MRYAQHSVDSAEDDRDRDKAADGRREQKLGRALDLFLDWEAGARLAVWSWRLTSIGL